MKNWKSFIGFFLFIIIYGVTSYNFNPVDAKNADIVFYTGLFAIIALLAVMSRSDIGTEVLKSIVEFAKLANIKTVAEFVSSAEIEKVVTELGIDYGQGFYYSAPKLL